MMKVLFDANLWISFMIGKRLSSLADVVCHPEVRVYVSEQLLDEIRAVIERPKFDKLIPSDRRFYFFEMVYGNCIMTDITVDAVSPIRDLKDLYLLSMAESVPVDYIVSGDRDLTDLGSHAGIPIISYADFLEKLKQSPHNLHTHHERRAKDIREKGFRHRPCGQRHLH